MRQRFWLFLPAWCLCAADVTLTLAGQTVAYWDGDYCQAIEHNPIARPFLVVHPWLFAGFALVWAVMFSLVILYWTHPGSGWLAILLALSHAIGGSSWLTDYGRFGWVLAIAYLAIAAWLSRISWRRAGLGQLAPPEAASQSSVV
jgi:hypothetical protein